jgi:hypothetical protein
MARGEQVPLLVDEINRAATALNLHDYRGHHRTWG